MRDCSWRLLHALQQLREEKSWDAEATEKLAGRQGQSRSSPDERLLREEVAERRGTSARGCSVKK